MRVKNVRHHRDAQHRAAMIPAQPGHQLILGPLGPPIVRIFSQGNVGQFCEFPKCLR